MNILEITFLENSLMTWAAALVTAFLVLMVLLILKARIASAMAAFLRGIKEETGQLAEGVIQRTRFSFLFALAVYAGSLALHLPASYSSILSLLVILIFLIQAGLWGVWIITFCADWAIELKKDKDSADATVLGLVKFVSKTALWSVVVLVALGTLGVDITALVAGLGVVGIAVALAVQNILGDLFASLTIVLDKPFIVGDFIIVGDSMGTVERVGLKTTRIRSLSGEQLIMPNSDLLQSRIRNYKRMQERRVPFSIRVVYETTGDKLKRIPGILKEVIESQEMTRFDRAHFKDYGNFSLNFEIVYWVLSPEKSRSMDIQQAINLSILERFQKEGIEFAYPTQTIRLNSKPDSD
jgi:small-conductance mechanosensitive channel